MKNNNILCGMSMDSNADRTGSYLENWPGNLQGDWAKDKRRAVLNLFLEDNPAFEVCLRSLQDRDLPDNDRIILKAYKKDEPLAALIYALHHLADDAGEGVPRLRCAPSGLRAGLRTRLRADEADMKLIRQQKVPGLALLRLLRGKSL